MESKTESGLLTELAPRPPRPCLNLANTLRQGWYDLRETTHAALISLVQNICFQSKLPQSTLLPGLDPLSLFTPLPQSTVQQRVSHILLQTNQLDAEQDTRGRAKALVTSPRGHVWSAKPGI